MPGGTKPPPRNKPNWSNLNHGQRIYAEKQYNKAQAAKGLSTTTSIPHTGTKRPANSSDESTPPPKQSATEPTAGTSGISNNSTTTMAPTGKGGVSESMDTSAGSADSSTTLPGTAQGQGAGGGTAGPGPRAVCVPRPRLNIHNNTHVYSKTHRFLTWGIAYDVLVDAAHYPDYKFMCTPFAQVPWDRPYFYLTPAEYDALPEGSVCKSVHITITPRNCRVAFPTNSSESNLATLNQNKDIVIAYELAANCHSVNAHYESFNAQQPMKPESFTIEKLEHHMDFAKDLYGERSRTDTRVPRHQAGIWSPLPDYALIPKISLISGTDPGWPCLQHYYKDFYADTTSGVQVESFSYHPQTGNIKKPYDSLFLGLNRPEPPNPVPGAKTSVVIPRGSHTLLPHQTRVTYSVEPARSNVDIQDEAVPLQPGVRRQFTYHEPIEKSQEFYYGNFSFPSPKVQPSVHIGVQPVPALTTAALQGQSNSSFTDVSAYFEISAEMEVEIGFPTPFPLFDKVHVTEHLNTYAGNQVDHMGKSMYNGLYQF